MAKVGEKELYDIFTEMGIKWETHEHPAIFHVSEGDELGVEFPGLNLKNLYIREKKKDDRYLVVMDEHKRLDFKGLRDITGWKKPTFGDEAELEEYMGVYPGGVTAFGVINDVDNIITVVLGKDIVEADDDTMVNLHPFRNTATTSIRKGDFMRYLEKTGNRVIAEK